MPYVPRDGNALAARRRKGGPHRATRKRETRELRAEVSQIPGGGRSNGQVLTREKLHAYADRVRRTAEREGRGSEYPTVRRCARSLRTTQALVLQAAEDAKDWGLPLDLAIGVQIGGGGGHAVHEDQGDYQIETWDEDPR